MFNEVFEEANKFKKEEFEYINNLFNKIVEKKTKNLNKEISSVGKNFNTKVPIGYIKSDREDNAKFRMYFDIFKGFVYDGYFNNNNIEDLEFNKDFIKEIENKYEKYEEFLQSKQAKYYLAIEEIQKYLNQL